MQNGDNEITNDPIARLLKRAGKRPVPPPDAAARIRARAHAEWSAGVQRVRRQRVYALAASVAALALGAWWMVSIRDQLPAAVVARIERGAPALRIAHAPDLVVGDRVATGAAGGVVLHSVDAQGRTWAQLRVAPESTLEWIAPAHVRLVRGALYVDTGETPSQDAAHHLLVEAEGVRVEHVGTRFLTQNVGEGVDVTVRDGRVQVLAGANRETLARGERARVHTAGGGSSIERLAADRYGEAWRWVDALAPRVAIEGRDLRTVARALAREAGAELRFASAALEAEAAATVLHGPALDLPPQDALAAVLATTRFEMRRQPDGSLLLAPPR